MRRLQRITNPLDSEYINIYWHLIKNDLYIDFANYGYNFAVKAYETLTTENRNYGYYSNVMDMSEEHIFYNITTEMIGTPPKESFSDILIWES